MKDSPPSVTMLPTKANFRKHFEDASAPFRSLDIHSLCSMNIYERGIEIDKVSQGLAAKLGPQLGAEIYHLATTRFTEALHTSVSRFEHAQDLSYIRSCWRKDVELILHGLIDHASARPRPSVQWVPAQS